MAYFKIGSKDDDLSIYISAENRDFAVRVFEDLVGPVNPAQLVCKRIPESELPEDVEVLE